MTSRTRASRASTTACRPGAATAARSTCGRTTPRSRKARWRPGQASASPQELLQRSAARARRSHLPPWSPRTARCQRVRLQHEPLTLVLEAAADDEERGVGACPPLLDLRRARPRARTARNRRRAARRRPPSRRGAPRRPVPRLPPGAQPPRSRAPRAARAPRLHRRRRPRRQPSHAAPRAPPRPWRPLPARRERPTSSSRLLGLGELAPRIRLARPRVALRLLGVRDLARDRLQPGPARAVPALSPRRPAAGARSTAVDPRRHVDVVPLELAHVRDEVTGAVVAHGPSIAHQQGADTFVTAFRSEILPP